MDGTILKKKLLGLRVSQKKLATLLEVTPQSVNAVLGASDVRSGTIEKIAKALNVPVTYFYSEGGGNVAMATGKGSAASNFGDSIVSSHSDNSGEIAILKERIAHLEELLDEKERLIQVLLGNASSPIK